MLAQYLKLGHEIIATTIQFNFPLTIIPVSAVVAEILTSSNTPQTQKQSVTITFKHCIYTQISTTPIPLPTPTPPVPTPLPLQAHGMYMKLHILTTVHV